MGGNLAGHHIAAQLRPVFSGPIPLDRRHGKPAEHAAGFGAADKTQYCAFPHDGSWHLRLDVPQQDAIHVRAQYGA